METQVVMDEDLKKVCEFMQRNIAADRLVSVAENLGAMAPILWGRYGRCILTPLLIETKKPDAIPKL
ncbi:MAG: hypothetical protein LKI99_06185 [Acetobacter fabarum]|jgi:hypothetical protein|nr:hypothetical protein [Acetobacter fabarum]MCI1909285.1 hypothetical protein [Acetobacter fabarum]MCI1927263.1 hypothetical protein [Acetobacter fabarum]MCI1947263.1 hypothetical protein [Acetobacter fabarum]MCI1988484.1 hypothetical protein [Acetobacter fabarum]